MAAGAATARVARSRAAERTFLLPRLTGSRQRLPRSIGRVQAGLQGIVRFVPTGRSTGGYPHLRLAPQLSPGTLALRQSVKPETDAGTGNRGSDNRPQVNVRPMPHRRLHAGRQVGASNASASPVTPLPSGLGRDRQDHERQPTEHRSKTPWLHDLMVVNL